MKHMATRKDNLVLNFEILKTNGAHTVWIVTGFGLVFNFGPIIGCKGQGRGLNDAKFLGPSEFLIVGFHFLHIGLLFFEFFQELILVRQNTFLGFGLEFVDFLLHFVWERGKLFEGFGFLFLAFTEEV